MTTLTLDVRIENTYAEHGGFVHQRAVSLDPPPVGLVVDGLLDEDLLADWAADELMPLTGEGLSGDACYEVTVLASPDMPELTGHTFTWEG